MCGGIQGSRQAQGTVDISKPLHKEAAFVVDAGVVRTANRFKPSQAKNFGGRVEERFCQLAAILAIKEPEKSGLVSIALIVCAVDDSGDPANRLAVAPGKKRMDFPVKAIEWGFRREILYRYFPEREERTPGAFHEVLRVAFQRAFLLSEFCKSKWNELIGIISPNSDRSTRLFCKRYSASAPKRTGRRVIFGASDVQSARDDLAPERLPCGIQARDRVG
ncbi:MAG TPA: hypothetical protein VIS96_14045 [Terrimicrobiaceae bacterium]